MNSPYLDVVPAFTDFFGHCHWENLNSFTVWQVQIVAHDRGIVHLASPGSGFQPVMAQKERYLRDYAVARPKSVLLPKLLLTVVCDSVGKAINSEIYALKG